MARRRRNALTLALLAALALGLAGCARRGEDRPNADATLMLDRPPGAVHAGIYLALERDFDGAEGVGLRVRAPSSRTAPLRSLLDGRAQFAILDINDLALARERGRDVVGVMALVQRPLAAVLAGPGVQRPRDLEGRRVGVSGRRADAAVLDTVVRHDGGDPGRVRRVPLEGGPVGAVRSGRVAAATGWWNTEGVALVDQSPRAHVFRPDDYGAPGYPELVVAVTRETLVDRRPVVRATVAALRRGYDEALADPESAVGALVDRVPGLDRTAMEDEFDAASPAFLEGVTRFGDLVPAALRAWARWEAAERLTKRPPDVGRAFAPGF
jgi:ABC-type nitrate/sulfonate/bicarbonate transport system substrate-binding protein